jgi:hypothetical protein
MNKISNFWVIFINIIFYIIIYFILYIPKIKLFSKIIKEKETYFKMKKSKPNPPDKKSKNVTR